MTTRPSYARFRRAELWQITHPTDGIPQRHPAYAPLPSLVFQDVPNRFVLGFADQDIGRVAPRVNCGHLAAGEKRRQSSFRRRCGAGNSRSTGASLGRSGIAGGAARFLCGPGDAIARRVGRSRAARPTDGFGQRRSRRHGGACLRRAMFRTRTAFQRIDRPRHHAARQRGAMFKAEGRGSPSDATRRAVLNTAPPGRAGRWRRRTMRTRRSGVEHGSTATSAVVAPRPILAPNGHADRVAANQLSTQFRPDRPLRSSDWFCLLPKAIGPP